jgi:hypothetical protein
LFCSAVVFIGCFPPRQKQSEEMITIQTPDCEIDVIPGGKQMIEERD